MPMICLRRDLADPRPLRSLARLASDEATLDALFLLSVADWSSVGPQAFSSWQRSLLDALYLRTREQLRNPGVYADPKGLSDAKRDALVALELGEVPQTPGAATDPIDDFVSALPTRYFDLVDLPTMQAHFRLWRAFLADGKPRIDVTPDRVHGQVVVTVVCGDSPGVLARLTGGLAGAGAEVLSAEIASLTSLASVASQHEDARPSVLDVFRVADPHGRFADRGAALIVDAIERALSGEPVTPRQASGLGPVALPPVKPAVEVHNDVASGHSVVDIVAADRPGLLFDLAQFFHGAGVSVDLAFVATEGRVAHDSFYVAGARGDKLQPERLAELAQALMTHLAGRA
jgi:[protein-PII] uridylyltransferase